MKKLFLIPVLALLAVVNAWGQNLAQIGDTEYATVKEAIAAAEDGVETQIDLIDDVVEQFIVITSGKNIILNLNGKSLTSDYYDGGQAIDGNATLCNYGTLKVISDGTSIVTPPVGAGEEGFPIVNHGDLTIEGGIFIGSDIMEYMANPCVWTYGGTTIINGGTFVLAQGTSFSWQGILGITDGGTLIVKGGRFSMNKVMDAGEKLNDYLGKDDLGNDAYKVLDNVSFSNTFASWCNKVSCVVPIDAVEVTSIQSISRDTEEESVVIASAAQMTVEAGTTLTISGDLNLTDETSKLVVEKGARVIVGDEIVAANTNNIELTMDVKGKSYSNLLVAGSLESHPNATVALNTRCKKITEEGKEDRFVWQRFAVPSYVDFDLSNLGNATGYQTAICGWNYENNRWEILPSSATLEPFQCYEMTINVTNDDAKYLFPCALVGSGNPNLTLRAGWNYFANAYTAPMNLKAWLIDLMEDAQLAGSVHGTVYVQNPKSNSWYDVTYADAKDNLLTPSKSELQPMQAFIYYGFKNTTIPLKYKEYVYDPIVNPGAVLAPRKAAAEAEYKRAMIVIEDENGEESALHLYEGEQFSEAFDNGYDAIKMMNDEVFNAYFATSIGDLSRLATNNIEDATITFQTYDASEFTLTFQNVTLEGYSLLDNVAEKKIEIKNGNSYVFSGEANKLYSNRFTIVKSGETTALDNTEVVNKAKGIYTLTGQYVGNNLNALPAGVYVVNGEKVVR